MARGVYPARRRQSAQATSSASEAAEAAPQGGVDFVQSPAAGRLAESPSDDDEEVTMHRIPLLRALSAALIPGGLGAQTPYSRTVIVSPVVGDPTASGTALRNAVNAISASPADRWLVKVEPGIYDVRDTSLTMKAYVDIEGSGPLATEIRGIPQPSFDFTKGVVNGAAFSELRDLAVTCDSDTGSRACIAIANYFVSPRFRNLYIVANSDTSWGFRNTAASPDIDGVEIVAKAGFDSYGIVNADDPLLTAKSRPTIRNSRIHAHAGSRFNIGILNKDDSSPLLVEDVSIKVESGSAADGILALEYFNTPDTMTVRRVTIEASSSANAHGIRDGYYTVLVQDSRIETEGSTSGGIYLPIADVQITHSQIAGDQIRVLARSTRIGSSWLKGAGDVEGLSELLCAGVFDSDLAFYPNTCP